MTFRNLQEAASSLRELARLQLLKEGAGAAGSVERPWQEVAMRKAGENHGKSRTPWDFDGMTWMESVKEASWEHR